MTSPNPQSGHPGSNAGVFVPLHRCRTCGRAATQFIDGKRRTFYCNDHGPTKVGDWTRLLTLTPDSDDTVSGRVLSLAPPLPPKFARLVDGIANALRELLADLPAAMVPDMELATEQAAEIVRLRAQLARVTQEKLDAEEIAREALELWPSAPTAEFPVVTPEGRTERDFPPPEPGPTPVAPTDPETFPGPIMPEAEPVPEPARPATKPPKRKSKGYTVHPKEPAAPEPVAAEDDEGDLPSVVPSDWITFTQTDVDLYSFETLVKRIPLTPDAPGLGITKRGLKDWKALSGHNKKAVLDAIQFLSLAPQNLREGPMHGMDDVVALRVNRGWRIIASKPQSNVYIIERIVNRGSKLFYKSER